MGVLTMELEQINKNILTEKQEKEVEINGIKTIRVEPTRFKTTIELGEK